MIRTEMDNYDVVLNTINDIYEAKKLLDKSFVLFDKIETKGTVVYFYKITKTVKAVIATYDIVKKRLSFWENNAPYELFFPEK